jgi:hypothetical protein
MDPAVEAAVGAANNVFAVDETGQFPRWDQ